MFARRIIYEQGGGNMPKAKKSYVIIGVMLLFMVLAGCASDQANTEAIRESIDPITENLLVAINEDDYVQYSRDFDQPMKNAMTEESFKQINPTIKAKIGNYISKEFVAMEPKDQYTIFYYKAKFSREPGDVIIKNVVREAGGRMYISGFWLDSPNLRK